jgi:hypothetical protein
MEYQSLYNQKLSTPSVRNNFWDGGIHCTLWAKLDFNNGIITNIAVKKL